MIADRDLTRRQSLAEIFMPNARHKLNASAIHGVLLVAGVVALLFQSWAVFWLLVIVLLATALHVG